MQEIQIWSLGWDDTLEKESQTTSVFFAWKIPWTEEPGGLQSMGSLRVGHNWVTSLSLSLSLSCIGEGNGNPLQCSCLENPKDEGAWWATVYGVTQSRTRLKWLISSISSIDLENKYKPEPVTIWHWTDPAMPTTAPEKFLTIFLLIPLFNF